MVTEHLACGVMPSGRAALRVITLTCLTLCGDAGLLGFMFDLALRMLQKRILYWVPETTGVLRGL